MTTVVKMPNQGQLFKLTAEQREEKIQQLLGALDELEHLKVEKKEFLAGIKDQMEDAEKRILVLREDLGIPESALGPQMRAARDEERAKLGR